jgi:hypothetical protein
MTELNDAKKDLEVKDKIITDLRISSAITKEDQTYMRSELTWTRTELTRTRLELAEEKVKHTFQSKPVEQIGGAVDLDINATNELNIFENTMEDIVQAVPKIFVDLTEDTQGI